MIEHNFITLEEHQRLKVMAEITVNYLNYKINDNVEYDHFQLVQWINSTFNIESGLALIEYMVENNLIRITTTKAVALQEESLVIIENTIKD